ncbi:hypothetical protein ABZP36_018537 [Zizania latifolia]
MLVPPLHASSCHLAAAAGEMDSCGFDSTGREFASATEMWAHEIGTAATAPASAVVAEATPASAAGSNAEAGQEAGGEGKRKDWYSKAITYWQGVEASTEGVLGGYGCVNDMDVKGSDAFLCPLLAERFGTANRHLVALDCGSGIGRVTKNFLLRHFNEVDLVEPVSHFLEVARENLAGCMEVGKDTHKAANFYCVPLQDFTPEEGRYDVIWIQWYIGQLTDDDFISFFNRAKVTCLAQLLCIFIVITILFLFVMKYSPLLEIIDSNICVVCRNML